jgi:hypothetical protein
LWKYSRITFLIVTIVTDTAGEIHVCTVLGVGGSAIECPVRECIQQNSLKTLLTIGHAMYMCLLLYIMPQNSVQIEENIRKRMTPAGHPRT